NMGKDFVIDVVEKIRSSYNSILVDSERLVFFVNMFIFKFHFLQKDYFLNHSLTEAKDKLFAILMVVVNAKIEILTRTHGLGILGEILLSNLDHKWTSHIDKMTKLREGVSLRSLEQKMPLNIYIEDGNKLFERMKFDIVESVFTSFLKLSLPNEELEIRNALTANSINPNSFKSSSKKIDLTLTEEAKEVIDEPVIIPTPEIIIDENEIFVSQTEHTDNIVIDNNLDIVAPTEEIKTKETLNKATKSKAIKTKETLNKTTKSKKIKTKKNI
ncbi:MAG: hypothetical protein RRZ34_01830, partial [Malacoplasma sp.]